MCRRNKGFTLPEILIAVTIASFILLSTWGVYTMGTAWWAKLSPRIEAQRIVRITLLSIVNGTRDSSAGTDTISGVTYPRRNGIAWATALPTTTSDANQEKITYNLKGVNNQTFYMLKTESPRKLYHNNAQSPVQGTTGLTGLSFQAVAPNFVTVTATVEKDVQVGEGTAYHIKEELQQTVYLRNI